MDASAWSTRFGPQIVLQVQKRQLARKLKVLPSIWKALRREVLVA